MPNNPHLEILSAPETFNLTFDNGGETVGRFWYENGELHFEGTATEAGRIFTDYIITLFKEWHDGR